MKKLDFWTLRIFDLRSKGLCYTWKETWSKGHKSKASGKIHMTEIVDIYTETTDSNQDEQTATGAHNG